MDKSTAIYLFLSLLSGVVELGSVIFAVQSSFSLIHVPLIGLAYQLGSLFKEPIELPTWGYGLTLLFAMTTTLFVTPSPLALAVAVLLLSVGIQGVRGQLSQTQPVATSIKRLSRVAGFGLSGLLTWHGLAVVSGLATILLVVFHRRLASSEKLKLKGNLKLGPLGTVMTVHQSHYFSYAYTIVPILVLYHDLSATTTSALFCLGWLSYIASQKIFGTRRLMATFCFGHLLAAASLTALYIFGMQSLSLFACFWFATGFGGGTVYCLRELRKRSVTDESDMDFGENLGHVIGVLIGIATLSLFKGPEYPFLVAAVVATLTCCAFVILVVSRENAFGIFHKSSKRKWS